MCDPVTAVMVVGAVVKGAGSVMGGKAKKEAAYDEASNVETSARIRAKNIRKLARETQSSARAGYAASGVLVDEGSPLEVDRHITRESELDAFYTILSGKEQAKSLRKGGNAAEKAGYIDAAGSAISAYGSYAGST